MPKKSKKYYKKKQKKTRGKRTSSDSVLNNQAVQNSSKERSYAIFLVGKEQFAIDLDEILEMLHTFDIISVPHLPSAFSGIVNLRGQSVPVVGLQRVLKEEQVKTEAKTCLITVVGSSKIGLLVDSDVEIVSSEFGSLHPLPDCYTKDEAKFLAGIFWTDDKLVGILRPKEMLEVLTQWREDDEKI